MTNEYSVACTEVLEILKYLPKQEKEKIPQAEIEFYKENSAKDYQFKIDPKKPIEEQAVSDMASAIIITIFRDYFADEEQKALLSEILRENNRKVEMKKREKYNPDKIFENKEVEIPKPAVIQKNKNIFQKILDFIKGIVRR